MAEEDILYGKNRHLFGGIEPSNLKVFTVTNENNRIAVNVELPSDTVIEGQTLCTVAGAIVRRSQSNYPKDEFDGELVANLTKSAVIIDPVNPNSPYYYSAFPYTTQGVYNRSSVNRARINIPDNMNRFSARSLYNYTDNSCVIELTVVPPENAVGVVIRKSEAGFPTNEMEGTEFMTITSKGVYVDENVELGKTYYYSAFPYNASGGYTRDSANFISVVGAMYNYLFGFDIDLDDPNPDTRVSYPADVDNARFKPATMNFAKSKFEYNDWDIKPGEMFMPRPCMLRYDGTVDHYLDPNDYTLRDDGVSESRVGDASFNGNAMMEWPKIYTYREEVNGVYKFRCSDMPQGEGWDCWCNYDKDNNQIDHFYTSIYCAVREAVNGNIRLRSISTGSYAYSGNDYAYYFNGARENGANWTMGVLADHLLIQDLLVLISKTTNGQAAFGYGKFNSGGTSDTSYDPGSMNKLGLFWGGTTYKDSVKVFGMEHWWGNMDRFVEGWVVHLQSNREYTGEQRVKITRGTYDGSGHNDYTANGVEGTYLDYLVVGGAIHTATNVGYISGMKTMPYGRIPYLSSGSSSTYEADQLYWSKSTSCDTVGWVLVGGSLNHGKESIGPFFASGGKYFDDDLTACATLSCKPLQTI